MIVRSTLLVAAALVLGACGSGTKSDAVNAAATGTPSRSADGSAVSCSSFQTQREAQVWFQAHGGQNLDPDGNGIACEGLPNR